MVDFTNLVLEVDETTADVQTNSVISYLTGEPLQQFNQAFSRKYTTPPLNPTSFATLLNVINKSANQANYVQGDFERYIDVFPYIDFATYVIQEATNNDKPIFTKWNSKSLANAPTIVTNYIDMFLERALENSWALDYPPVTARALILGTDLRKKRYNSIIGELTLSNYANKSLKDTIFGILAARKKIRNKQGIEEVPYIREMLLTPEKFAGGTTRIPEQFSSLYDRVTSSEILSLGSSIKKLFEILKTLVEQQLNKDEAVTNVVTTTITEFFDNSSIKNGAFRWNYKTQKGQASLNLDSINFDEMYSELWQSLNENETQGELFAADTNLQGNTPKMTTPPVFGKTNQPTQQPNPLNGPKNGYTIDTIKNMKNIDAAIDLYKKLENFANYIREKEPVNWATPAKEMLGGLRDVFKGLSLGVPDPGAQKR